MHITLVFPTIDLHHKVELAIQKRWNQKLPAPTTSAPPVQEGWWMDRKWFRTNKYSLYEALLKEGEGDTSLGAASPWPLSAG